MKYWQTTPGHFKLRLLSSLVTLSILCGGCGSAKKVSVQGDGRVETEIRKNPRAEEIIFEAAVGGEAGAVIGTYMDRLAAEMSSDLTASMVERLGEGLVVRFDLALLFEKDSYVVKENTRSHLARLVAKLLKHQETDVVILSHTLNTGDAQYNLAISEKRAEAINAYLIDKRVYSRRIDYEGWGGSDPFSSKDEDNARIEVLITAKKSLVRKAKRGRLDLK